MQDNRNTGNNNLSLLLLGGLAALVLSRDVKRGIVSGTHLLMDESQKALDDSIKPALGEIARATQHNLQALGEQAPRVVATAHHLLESDKVDDMKDNLRSGLYDLRGASYSVLGQLQDQLGQWSEQAQDRLQDTRQDADKTLGRLGKLAKHEVAAKQSLVSSLIGSVADEAQSWLGEQQHSFKREKRDAVKLLEQARRKAERELRAKRDWDTRDLERAVEKRIAPLAKQTKKTLAKIDKQANRQYKALTKQRRAENESAVFAMLPVGLLIGGAVVLARVPATRHSVIDAAEKISPDLASKLHDLSRYAQDNLGGFWVAEEHQADAQAERALTEKAESVQDDQKTAPTAQH